jgi:3-oxoacyl-[acyl-carrier-protein] synthase-1
MRPLKLSHYTVTTACGAGVGALLRALREGRTGLRPGVPGGNGASGRFNTGPVPCWVGEIDGLSTPLAGEFSHWDCRSNRLMLKALQQDGFIAAVAAARRRYSDRRVGLFIGTSASGVQQTEIAYRLRDRAANRLIDSFDYVHTQNLYSPAGFARELLELKGCGAVVSTACSSSAKVFGAAARAIACGWCDAAVVGGIDSLCLTTLAGFSALQLLSADICRPADEGRSGISVGEAAGFALLEPEPAAGDLALLGCGESADAHHMSAPDPQGRGAMLAMRHALDVAGCQAPAIDYVNLHGTATAANDATEDRAVTALFGDAVPCSSTKGWTGHTLGAAGIVEAAVALLCIEHGFIPQSLNTMRRDPALAANIAMQTRAAPVERVLSNSFGFGGSNCSLLFGRV